ncbi:MAG: aminotransferase class V-fold PLP-dependent enzyme [Anaerolineaceae bacterium]|nr:aminotransferase class V-fold PLP-dependent enzyme [Anaerolineaceae bacterium]
MDSKVNSQPIPVNNTDILLSLEEEKQKFLTDYPNFQKTSVLDKIRKDDYPNLDQQGHTYLDFTGAGLYAQSQVMKHHQMLQENVFGNPHSSNPTSLTMTRLVEKTRETVLGFFNADPKEYICIFTHNASGALKLVGESYPFSANSHYLLTYDNHNSVNGIREFARSKSAKINYIPVLLPDLQMDQEDLRCQLKQKDPVAHSLFAYPAQSNFSGVQHSLEWINIAKEAGWDVLLDAAAYVPTNQLDLQQYHPDFVTLSFYKIFGYPTGVGLLLARRDALSKLQRPWFAGGTITVASVKGDRFYLHQGAEGFEDGTLNYLSLPAIEIGLNHISTIGYEMIHHRVVDLTGWLIKKLTSIRHNNGKDLISIYGPASMENRGGTIAMNFYDPGGHFIDHLRVEARANEMGISLRTGCFCNPGDGEMALGLSADELTSCFAIKTNFEYQDFRSCLAEKSTGAVRVSLGLVSNFEDVYQMVKLAESFVDLKYTEV